MKHGMGWVGWGKLQFHIIQAGWLGFVFCALCSWRLKEGSDAVDVLGCELVDASLRFKTSLPPHPPVLNRSNFQSN
jgi:hypothetical protein